MIRAFLLLAGLGIVFAAPRFHHHHHGPFGDGPAPFRGHSDPFSNDFFSESVFDTNRFWSQLTRELEEMERALQDFSRHFPSSVSQSGIEGNQYKINIPLTGYQERDIVVKGKENVLMIQAVHRDAEGNERNYIDVRTLPSYVNINGSWTYDGQMLRIVFSLNSLPATEVPEVEQNTEVSGTVFPELKPEVTNGLESKERIEPTSNENVDNADVGINHVGDRDIVTNEISGSTVEATTYAVDLKDEVEFVPIRY